MTTIGFFRTGLAATVVVLTSAVLGAAGPPAVGSAAPAFTLTSDQGKPTSLADYKGKWVVLYFYPKDFTGG
jgi:peroxiredoxin Q/BCP